MAVSFYHLFNNGTQEILASVFARNHDEAACQLLTTLAKQAHREGTIDATEAMWQEYCIGTLTVVEDAEIN